MTTERRPLDVDAIDHAFDVSLEEDAIDIAVSDMDALRRAVAEFSGQRASSSTPDDMATYLFGMRVLVDTSVPPGVIEFREAWRLPL